MFVSSPLLTFDSKTGILTSATGQFSDVLLNKLGVSFIFGGLFDLLDYSENLNFTLVRLSPPFELIILPAVGILFVLVVSLAYRSTKKRRAAGKSYSKNSLKSATQDIKRR